MLKISIIGGGSTYTPELIQGFVDRQEELPLDELWLMDIDSERLDLVGSFAKRMADNKKARFKVVLSEDQRESIQNSNYIITQLRVGQMKARREDEYLANRYGLIGQETTGIGGMAKALRTIPVILDVADDVKKLAPEALLINFANPAGLVTEALNLFAPGVNAVGVCNATHTTKMEILNNLNEQLGTLFQPEDAQIKTLGLNHLTWFYGFLVHGQEFWPQIMRMMIEEMGKQSDPLFDPNTLQTLQMLPNYYLRYYYYTEKMLEKQKHWPPSRAEEVMEIEADLLDYYGDESKTDLPENLMKRGGAYYSTVAAQLINAHYNQLEEIHVLNVRHNGAVQGWEKDWVLEMPCMVSAKGIEPIPTPPLPLECASLVQRVKAYEIFTAHAAAKGDRVAAYKALLSHPLGPDADQCQRVLDDMLEINRVYLPRFYQ